MRSITMLAQEAAIQKGLLTIGELRLLGETKNTVAALVRAGLLKRVHKGVYVVFGFPESWEQRVMAVILAGSGRAVASHCTAIRLLGLWSTTTGIEVAVRYPDQFVIDGAFVHRSLDLCDSDIVDIDGIPTTKIERTLCDVGLLIGLRELRRLTFHAVATQLTTGSALERYVDRVARQGRNGVGPMHQVLEHLPSVAGESGPELELYSLLSTTGLPEPVAQYEIQLSGRTYRIDLAYPEQRLAIEYDGFAPHSQRPQFERDRQRQNAFVLHGWTVLRFTAADLRDRPYAVVAEVSDALHAVS